MSKVPTLKLEYYNELISRLFHSKSYFMHCATDYLRKYGETHDKRIGESVFLITNLLQFLADSDQSIDELDLLVSLPGFENFSYRLKERIERINFSGGTPEKMKEVIKKIAQFVVNELRVILRDVNAKQSLAMYLGLDSSVDLNETEDTDQLRAFDDDSSDTEIPIGEDSPLPTSDDAQHEAASTDEFDYVTMYDSDPAAIGMEAVADASVESTSEMDEIDFPAEKFEEPSSIIPNPDKVETGITYPENTDTFIDTASDGLTEDLQTPLSLNADEEEIIQETENTSLADSLAEIEQALENDEFESIVPASMSMLPENDNGASLADIGGTILSDDCKTELLHTLDDIRKMATENVATPTYWKLWHKNAQQLRLTSMMYGHDEIEAVANRLLRIIDHASKQGLPASHYTQELFEQATDVIRRFVQEALQADEMAGLIAAFDRLLVNSGDITAKNEAVRLKTSKKIPDASNKFQLNGGNAGKILEAGIENQPNITKPDDSEFKLPGEDDPELLSLIREISTNRQQFEHDMADVSTSSGTDKKDEAVADQIMQDQDDIVPDAIHPATSNKQAHIVNTIFNYETALYFKLINRALKVLNDTPDDESALEDLELASSSLKSHALIFGYEKLSELPGTIEQIAGTVIEQGGEIPNDILVIIGETIVLLQTFIDNAEYREKYKTLLYDLNKYLQKLIKQRKTIADM